MAKGQDQKLKLLYVKEFIENKSSESNPVNANQIIEYLSDHNISAERKSVYDDVDALSRYGMDIAKVSGRDGGYYLNNSDEYKEGFKVIIDTLNSSKYLPTRVLQTISSALAQKLLLEDDKNHINNVYVPGREKTINSKLFNNISQLSEAIKKQNLIDFQYLEWKLFDNNGRIYYEQIKRHDEGNYNVHPIQIIYSEQNYYLVGIDLDLMENRHYRIDKIVELKTLDKKNHAAIQLAARFDPSRYSKSLFEMFDGDERTCQIEFDKELIGVMLERFGDDMIILKSKKENYYQTVQHIKLSQKFYAWILSYAGRIIITGPENVKSDFRDYIQNILDQY